MKSEKMIKSSSFGSKMRKRLSDITNLHSSQHKSPFKKRENLLPAVEDIASKAYIENLVQVSYFVFRRLILRICYLVFEYKSIILCIWICGSGKCCNDETY